MKTTIFYLVIVFILFIFPQINGQIVVENNGDISFGESILSSDIDVYCNETRFNSPYSSDYIKNICLLWRNTNN